MPPFVVFLVVFLIVFLVVFLRSPGVLAGGSIEHRSEQAAEESAERVAAEQPRLRRRSPVRARVAERQRLLVAREIESLRLLIRDAALVRMLVRDRRPRLHLAATSDLALLLDTGDLGLRARYGRCGGLHGPPPRITLGEGQLALRHLDGLRLLDRRSRSRRRGTRCRGYLWRRGRGLRQRCSCRCGRRLALLSPPARCG